LSYLPPLFFDAFEQNRGGFVVGVLGHELAAEGLGEDGLGELVYVGLGLEIAFLNTVGVLEDGLDIVDDSLLTIALWRTMDKRPIYP